MGASESTIAASYTVKEKTLQHNVLSLYQAVHKSSGSAVSVFVQDVSSKQDPENFKLIQHAAKVIFILAKIHRN
jgi:hypothetical protein